MLQRRNLIIGAVAGLITAPAIVRASSIMPIKIPKRGKYVVLPPILDESHYLKLEGTITGRWSSGGYWRPFIGKMPNQSITEAQWKQWKQIYYGDFKCVN